MKDLHIKKSKGDTLTVYTLHTALQGIKVSPFDFFKDTK